MLKYVAAVNDYETQLWASMTGPWSTHLAESTLHLQISPPSTRRRTMVSRLGSTKSLGQTPWLLRQTAISLHFLQVLSPSML